jgi:PPOX class probable F420-dependent enzyme
MPMTAGARERFLAEPRIGTFVVARDGRAPLAVPVWYDYKPGGDVRIWMDRGTLKDRLLRDAGRLSLCVQTETRPYRYVTVEGPVRWNDMPTTEEVTPIAARYLQAAEVAVYVQQTLGPTSVLVDLRPEHWLSSDLSAIFEELEAAAAAST